MPALLAGALFALPACSVTGPRGHDVNEMVANARSAEDHLAIADYYRGEARLLQTEIEEHQRLEHVYRSRSEWAEQFRTRQIERCTAMAKRQGELKSIYEDLAREHDEEARRVH